MQQAIVLLDTVIHTVHHGPPKEEQKQQLVMHVEPSVDCKFLDFDFKKVAKFINNKLSEISSKHSCRVLFVAERSSHVWGSSRPESDHDVTAIIYFKARWYYSPFKQMSRQWKEVYGPRDKSHHQHAQKSNSTESKEETSEIEKIGDLDVEINCNELTKTCHEIIKNDPNIFEMLTSPLAYYTECPTVLEKLREIVYRTYDWHKLGKHYMSWSIGNYRGIMKSKKKRVIKKPLKIMMYVWRGILSAEWLLTHQTCKGLPLYIPDLIAFSKLLDAEEKRILMSLLIDKVQKSNYAVDCAESRKMMERVPEVQDIVQQMMKSAQHESAGKKSHHSAAQILEELVYEIIESFK